MPDIQFIAYQLQTAAEGDRTNAVYPGLSDQQRDIELRAKVFMDAVNAANSDRHIDAGAKKIFMAPEFFFRGGKDGVYEVSNVSLINEILDEYLADSHFDNWIFVLGTALAMMPSAGGVNEIINVSLIRKGGVRVTGAGGNSSNSLLIYKEYVSAIDFKGPHFGKSSFYGPDLATGGQANVQGTLTKLSPTSGANPSGLVSHIDPPNKHGEKHTFTPSPKFREAIMLKFTAGEITNVEKDRLLTPTDYTTSEASPSGLGGGTNFTMDGIRFTLEICLDHIQRRAIGTGVSDIHLVTSCGMEPKYANVKDRGLFFLCDGRKKSADCVHAYDYDAGRATIFHAIALAETIDMEDTTHWKLHPSSASNLFEAGRGNVHIYSKKALNLGST